MKEVGAKIIYEEIPQTKIQRPMKRPYYRSKNSLSYYGM
jgi:hypothetical protein